MGADGALASLIDPAEHRRHRSYLSSLFSAQTTIALKPRLLETLIKTAGYLQKADVKDKSVNIQNIYSELIVRYMYLGLIRNMSNANSRLKGDVVCELMFADSYNFIESGDEGHPLLNEVDNLGSITWLSMSIH